MGLSIGVLEVETIVVHGRWRFKILDSTSIYWGSPLESIGGVVLMLVVNKYIHQLLYSWRYRDHCSLWEVEIGNNS